MYVKGLVTKAWQERLCLKRDVYHWYLFGRFFTAEMTGRDAGDLTKGVSVPGSSRNDDYLSIIQQVSAATRFILYATMGFLSPLIGVHYLLRSFRMWTHPLLSDCLTTSRGVSRGRAALLSSCS